MFCKYYRWKLAQALYSDKPLPKLLDRHVRYCGACRSFYEQQQEIAERLGRDAVVSQSELPEGLKGEIMNAIVAGNPVASRCKYPSAAPRIWRGVPAAACVGLVALGIVLVWLNRQEKSDIPKPVGPPDMNPWTMVNNLAKEFGAEEDLSGWSGLIEKPMVEEWEILTAEATSAVQFIVSCVAVDFKQNDAESG
jgi:hypothetical protein